MTKRVLLLGLISLTVTLASAQTAAPSPSFEPFERWKSAVLAGDAASLKSMYSTDPPATVRINSAGSDAEADINFWLALKPRSIKVDVVRNEPRHGHISYIFRAEVGLPDGGSVSLTDDQSWQEQGGQWRLINVERTDAPRLQQPSSMKKNLYPTNADAHAEIKEAEEKAAR